MNEHTVVNLRDQKKPEEYSPPPSLPRPRRKKGWTPILIFMFVALALGLGAYWQFFRGSAEITDGEIAQKTQEEMEVQELVEAVGKLIVLPANEEPTVATVTDPEKLEGQLFFRNAKVGHKVLIYTQAAKAYLYDPEIGKLIEVAPITTSIE